MEWLNYHHLYYFWLVVKEGGFSKAASKLRIAQSAVSHQVSQLEDFLGQKLLDRNTKGFRLTEAGQVTYSEAESIFRQGQDLLAYFRSEKTKKSFHVGVLGSLSKNLQLKILNEIISKTNAELSLEIGNAQTLLERLKDYHLDAIISDVPYTSEASLPLIQQEIAKESVCLITRKIPRGESSYRIQQVLSRGLYLPSKGSPITTAVLDSLKRQKFEFPIRGHIDDIAFLRLLALETDCAVAIPRVGAKRELDSGELEILLEFKRIHQSYFLIYRQFGKRNPLLEIIL